MSSQIVNLKALGLYTYSNQLDLPQGALSQADNVVINRDGIIEPRRGFKRYGNALPLSTDRCKQLLVYKDRILRHYSSTLQFDSNAEGTFTSFPGTYSEVTTGLRIKGIEANGNFYFTTLEGIKKISALTTADLATATPTSAGGIKALDFTYELTEDEGFLTQASKVAYRVVWGIKDKNNNLILGAPSYRVVIANPIINYLLKDFNNLVFNLDTAAAVTSPVQALTDTDYKLLKLPPYADEGSVNIALQALCAKLDADLGITTFSGITVPPTPTPPATTEQALKIQQYYDAIVSQLNTLDTTKISSNAKNALIATNGVASFLNSTQSSTVRLEITIPNGVTTQHFYQVYRTEVKQSEGASTLDDIDPGDEMGLVYEDNPTATDITNKYVVVTDITSDGFIGANLYTNEASGEGILQQNEIPPLAHDITPFKGSTFYANTKTKHRRQIAMIGVDSITSNISKLNICLSGGSPSTYTFVSSVPQQTQITCISGSSFKTSGYSDYFTIYTPDGKGYRVYFLSGSSIVPPMTTGLSGVPVSISGTETDIEVAQKIRNALLIYDDFVSTAPTTNVLTLECTKVGSVTPPTEDVDNVGFTVAVTITGSGEDIKNKKIGISDAETVAQKIDETARSIVRVINRQNSEIVTAYYISGPEDVPGKILLEAKVISDNSFYIYCDDHETTGQMFNPFLPDTGISDYQTSIISDNEVSPNRLYFSKNQQPEAVPILSFIDIGAKDSKIERIAALRDSLFVFKSEGIYRVTGEVYPNFSSRLFDPSVKILAADSVQVLNNQIFLVSDQGVVMVSETGVSIISRQIEDKITSASNKIQFSTKTFGVGYEIDRSYLLWTVTKDNDTVANQCFRYNTFTQTWTRFPISKTCGIYNKSDQKIYMGSGDSQYSEKERKDFLRTDYADFDFEITLNDQSIVDTNITFPNLNDIEVGDAIVQTQYLTLYQFNRVLLKLDMENGLDDSDYYSTLQVRHGSSLANSLINLADKIDADLGVSSYSSIVSGALNSNQPDLQIKFNSLIDALNTDSNLYFNNYPNSTGTTIFECIIKEITSSKLKSVRVDNAPGFIIGPVSIYKNIKCEVVYAPVHFSTSGMLKQVREASLIFENKNFSSAFVGFSSDVDTSITEYEFYGVGNGDFGTGVFGQSYPFGGLSNKTPFRTYIPRNKQRCRFIQPKFKHLNAREYFGLYGVSLVSESSSERAYK